MFLAVFFSNFSIISISIFGISHLIKNKNYNLFLNVYSIFFFFCLYISLNSILSNHIDFKSVKSSIFFIRYFFLIIGIYYLYKFNNKIFNYYFNIYLIILIFLFLDTNYQYLNDGTNIFGFNSYIVQNARISSFFLMNLYWDHIYKNLPFYFLVIFLFQIQFNQNYSYSFID